MSLRPLLRRGFATAAEVERHQISRTIQRTRYAELEKTETGAIVHAAVRPKDKASPFLVLDFASMPRGTGFPDHPHRGLTTVTQILKGQWDHEDFLGNAGRLQPGEIQWMTAGRGIMHSEMPHFEDDSSPTPVAMQLWVDLPEKDKMTPPSYQGLTLDEIPVVRPSDGVEIGVISGESHGAVNEKRPVALGGTWWLDIKLTKPGAKVWQPLPAGWTAFLYVIEGNVRIHEGAPVDEGNTAFLTKTPAENGVLLSLPGESSAHVGLFAGPPLDQVAWTRGPFVMCSEEDAKAAVDDFNNRTNGFEAGKGWESKIGQGHRLHFPKIGIE